MSMSKAAKKRRKIERRHAAPRDPENLPRAHGQGVGSLLRAPVRATG